MSLMLNVNVIYNSHITGTTNMIKQGDKVLYQYYNSIEKKYYGKYQEGVIDDIFLDWNNSRVFQIKLNNVSITIKRNEIKRIIK